MRFLVDNALSPKVSVALAQAGHDAVHVRDYRMQAAPDEEILERAAREARIVVTADSDFATLMALEGGKEPSVILMREPSIVRVDEYVNVLLANLPALESSLERGCIVVFKAGRVRVRRLPIWEGQ